MHQVQRSSVRSAASGAVPVRGLYAAWVLLSVLATYRSFTTHFYSDLEWLASSIRTISANWVIGANDVLRTKLCPARLPQLRLLLLAGGFGLIGAPCLLACESPALAKPGPWPALATPCPG